MTTRTSTIPLKSPSRSKRDGTAAHTVVMPVSRSDAVDNKGGGLGGEMVLPPGEESVKGEEQRLESQETATHSIQATHTTPIEAVLKEVLAEQGIASIDLLPYVDVMKRNLVLTTGQLYTLSNDMIRRLGLPLVLENGLISYVQLHRPQSKSPFASRPPGEFTRINSTPIISRDRELGDTIPEPVRRNSLEQPQRRSLASISTHLHSPSSSSTFTASASPLDTSSSTLSSASSASSAPSNSIPAGWGRLRAKTEGHVVRAKPAGMESYVPYGARKPPTPYLRSELNTSSASTESPPTFKPTETEAASSSGSSEEPSVRKLSSTGPNLPREESYDAAPFGSEGGSLGPWISTYLQLTDRGRQLIRHSWDAFLALPVETVEKFYSKVYKRLTGEDELSRKVFEARGTGSSPRKALHTMFALVVDALDHPEQLPDKVTRFGVTHCIMGVQRRSYGFMVSAFVESLEETLGKTLMSAAAKEAWTGLLTRFSELFMEEYQRADRGVCGWLYARQGGKWKFYFTRLTPHKLMLYKTDTDAVPKIIFELSNFEELVQTLSASTNDPTVFKFCLRLVNGKQKQFCSTSRESRIQWITDLGHRLEVHATMRKVAEMEKRQREAHRPPLATSSSADIE